MIGDRALRQLHGPRFGPLTRSGVVPTVAVLLGLLVSIVASPWVEAAPGIVARLDVSSVARAESRAAAPTFAAEIMRLDPVRSFPNGLQPKSDTPAGGIAFVRCTRLWRALPDGSDARLVLDMTGISSPTFAPNARTIAFIVGGTEIWMTSTEGAGTTRIGSIEAEGKALEGVQAMNLTWSPDGSQLAFALVSDGVDSWLRGAAIWRLDLEEGAFHRDGLGWPVPAWQRTYLTYPTTGGERGVYLDTSDRSSDRKLSRGGTPLGAAFNRDGWSGIWGRGVVVIRDEGRGLGSFVGYRPTAWSTRDRPQTSPPPGFSIAPYAQPAISQDARAVYVDLLDRKGDPVLGLLDVPERSWTLLQYAWHPETSPAPTVADSFFKRRATWLASDLLNRGDKASTKLMLIRGQEGAERSLQPFKGWVRRTMGQPGKTPNGWKVPVMLFGKTEDGPFSSRSAVVMVSAEDGRLEARVKKASKLEPVKTVDDALNLLQDALPGIAIAAPVGLPAGTDLDPRGPVDAWTWRKSGTGTLNLRVPKVESGHRRLSYAYGDVSLSLGCGGELNPQPVDIGVPAVIDHSAGTRQIIWPATLKDKDHATFTVYGSLPKETLMELARQLVAAGAR